MNNDEFYEYEDRAYINPTLSSGEQEAFISNLRDIQGQNNAQIAEQTYNLGTAVPSNLGGLGGGEAYFTSRYQTPQVNDMVATLQSAAQAQALNDVMSNYQNQLQNRYKQAYRSAQKRARARAAAAAAGTGGNGTQGGYEKDYNDQDTIKFQSDISAGTNADLYKQYGRVTTQAMDVNGRIYRRTDDNGNIVYTNEAGYKKGSDGFYHPQSYFNEQIKKQQLLNSPAGKLAIGAAALTKLMNGR